jgi:LPXTG-motif cell wall-anchored protein
VTADVALMTRIMQSPESFYVNVHTSDFPGGAVRGQLAISPIAEGGLAPAPATPALPTTGADAGTHLALLGGALAAGAVGLGLSYAARRRSNH